MSFYSECGDLYSAHQLFDEMPHKNVVTWTSMISSYVQHGSFQLALGLFKKMIVSNEMPNHYTLSVVVRACTVVGYVDLGVQIHGLIVCVGLERDEFAGSSFLDFNFKVMGDLDSAFRVFDGLYRIDVFTWNVMISGLAQDGDTSEVLRMLSEMQVVDGLNPNDSTIVGLLKCCYILKEVEQVHGLALKTGFKNDIAVGSSLMDSYGKVGSIDLGQKILGSLELNNNTSCFVWSSIISSHARNGCGKEAITLFRDMCRQGMRPNQHAPSSALKACADVRDLSTGVQVQQSQMIKNGFRSDCFVGSVLISLYADAGKICKAEKLFRRIDDKDIVAWNAMITCCAQVEEGSAATCISFFQELCRTTTLEPNGATLFTLLKSCQSISDLVVGIQIHAMISKLSLGCVTRMGNAVINMYSRFGAVDDAYKAFNDIVSKDEVSWSSVIRNYQQNGFALDALRLCKVMMADGMVLTNFSPSIMCCGLRRTCSY
ncbi:hypothetical protein RJ639_018571 [Escallonia herrerae]|uniref:Pentatricopeptide repeat-containing protein n=1 Tax=Escallonia herrerae TaxID=1293975 RepID=A0AA88VA80_9ASTE|nr:hypothetical protein RJ639_018571 [Escallonia herrerae]